MKALNTLLFASACSTAGSLMSTVALTTLVYAKSGSGEQAAFLQAISLLGIAAAGIFGGFLLSKSCATRIGMSGRALAIAVLLPFALWPEAVPVPVIYAAILVLAALVGIEHPNLMRVVNWNVDPAKRAQAFSKFQTLTQALLILSPLVAGFLISRFGARACITVDILSYLLSLIAWHSAQRTSLLTRDSRPKETVRFWEGYTVLATSALVRKLNVARVLTNVSYVSFNVCLPLFVSAFSGGQSARFAELQGTALAALNVGFVAAGVLGGILLKKNQLFIPRLSVIGSVRSLCWRSAHRSHCWLR